MTASPERVMARAQELLVRNAALRVELAETRAASRQIRRMTPPRIGGASDPDSSGDHRRLREDIRLRLTRGLLPFPDPTMWVGRGSRGACSICTRQIREADVEYELWHGDERVCAHLACYSLWREEARALGIASSRERGERTSR